MEALGLKLGFIVNRRNIDWEALVEKLLSDCSRREKKDYVYALNMRRENSKDLIWRNYVKMYCADSTIPHDWVYGLAPHSYKLSNRELIY
jgi:hypothetical protein